MISTRSNVHYEETIRRTEEKLITLVRKDVSFPRVNVTPTCITRCRECCRVNAMATR
jgi:hypothetical protein